jgi:hypothetical protein
MMADFYNINLPGEEYTKKDGSTGPSWKPVGKVMIKDNGKVSVYLNITGLWYPAFPDIRDDGNENWK